ncbi:MAG: leucine--tRNA ligase [Candidatus Aegiribacteria sp.]|nr:leucine--tRNA ligase [Candidatus Aegiribacteria sp.]MBD3294059.1 leucine--tRNA ligase [Candidatus Fermentibacteria bacterium]
MDAYDYVKLEKKWRPVWEKMGLYRTGSDMDSEPFYCLDYFPYPSGAGLSVGHCKNYIPTDVICRKKRMDGFNVLHPMGWDAFGQPAEEYAIKTNTHPSEVTRINSDTYRRQMKLIEASYDWEREINSSDPGYYKWTQYFFNLLFDRGLAYQRENDQMWCPQCKIVLSNEEAAGGICWRCGGEVTRKKLRQWYFRITEYADRLLRDLDDLDWPEGIKAMQRNWIGKSRGAEVVFKVKNPETEEVIDLPVYTTRLDTIYGATFCVLAPEYPDIEKVLTSDRREVALNYIAEVKTRSDIERTAAAEREKTGVFTGSFALNPYSGEEIPVYVADYVIAGYGTAAIMAVPAHDERDHAFAVKYGIPILEVIAPDGIPRGVEEEATVADGQLMNSGPFTGMDSVEARKAMADYAEEKGIGKAAVRYRIRDWLVSRQRYWGAPIPIIHCRECGAVPDRDLPVVLPEMENFEPDDSGKSPLARAEDWVSTTCPRCGGPARRDTDTMAGFACSSWYFLRFASPHEEDRPFDPEAVDYWLPVDLYVGGAEHAVMHLIYARFWTKVMYDADMLDFHEPFSVLKNQGMILGADGQKMSKSKGNVITPDEMVEKYGADALRLYILFMGPFEAELDWSEEGIAGTYRFLKRVWRVLLETADPEPMEKDEELISQLHYHTAYTVKKVTCDMDSFAFNTAVAALMEFVNFLSANRERAGATEGEWRKSVRDLLLMLAPMTPFAAEELWHRLDYSGETVFRQDWPGWQPEHLERDTVEMVVQIKGKIRARIEVPTDASEEEVQRSALKQERIEKLLNGGKPRRIIVVPGKLVNIIP